MGERRTDEIPPPSLPPRVRTTPPTATPELVGDLARGTEPLATLDPASELRQLETKLDSCLAALAMHYQPIVRADTRGRFAYEALLRSHDKSLPHPGAILDAAERLERVQTLGRAVRSQVARAVAE